MIRTFLTHKVREYQELEGLWDYVTIDEDGEPGKYYQLMVPGCWENHPSLGSYRGRGRYSRAIPIEGQKNVRLEFKGVSHTAEVYWDGIKVAGHYNAYTPFEVIIPEVASGVHLLEILVDNRFTEESSLHIPNDYYTYGGLTRPVVMEYVPDVYIHSLYAVPYREEGIWKLNLTAQIHNLSSYPQTVQGIMNIGQEQSAEFSQEIVNKWEWNVSIPCPKAESWTCEHPRLYDISLEVTGEGGQDDLRERTGFREIRVEGDRILLNGEELLIQGYNRHEDSPSSGCSLSVMEINRDLDLIQNSHANLIRTSHYPNDERFLDLCDEKGILVWEESHARGLSEQQMRHIYFQDQSLKCIEEMVHAHKNHPCIIIWGLLNECASDTIYGRNCYQEQIERLRELDHSRPISFASDKHQKDLCLNLVDIVSFNIYPEWYENKSAASMAEELREVVHAMAGSDKPILISEFGAGALYGYRSPLRDKWSEERQMDIIRHGMEQLMAKEFIKGVILWQFCDCRVTEEEWALKRPKTQNNKGVLDQYRRPKLAYEMVSRLFQKGRSHDSNT